MQDLRSSGWFALKHAKRKICNLTDLFVRGGPVGICNASKVFLPSVRFHPNLDTGLNIRVNRITRDRKEEDGCFPGSACGRPVEGLDLENQSW